MAAAKGSHRPTRPAADQQARRLRPEKLPTFLEAVYALEREDEAWLRGVAAAARDVWGRPGGTVASFFDASDLNAYRRLLVVTDGLSKETVELLLRSTALMTPAMIARLFRRSAAGTVRDAAPELVPHLAETEPLGIADSFGLFGSDPNGLGCSVSILMSTAETLGADELGIYRRMAAHMGTAFRYRRRLRAEADARGSTDPTAGAEAVLDPSGKVLHAEGPAKSRAARTRLQEAVRGFDDARTRGRRGQPGSALDQHHPLVEARWTLADVNEPDGRRIVARENLATVGGLEGLTDRERQVVAFLALGRTTKEVAYALGISDSTTRVLLGRASARLGVRSRDDLVRVVTRDALPGLADVDTDNP
jgi:DNA-binding CsgD family transcriptional regulator